MPRRLAALWILFLAAPACTGPSDQSYKALEPDIVAFTPTVDLGGVVVLYDAQGTAKVGNAGLGDLEISNISIANNGDGVYSAVYPGEFPIELDTDETLEIDLGFAPKNYVDYNRSLLIESDDPDSPQLFIPLTGSGIDGPIPDISVDPPSVDFGLVTVGTRTQQYFTITNDGLGELTVESMDIVGSDAFTFATAPTVPFVVPAETTTTIILDYAPTVEGGENATVAIGSTDPDEPEVSVLLLGNGGGDLQFPVAEIVCPGDVAPPITVDLDGRGSYDPLGGELTFDWEVVERPSGSRGGIIREDEEYNGVFVDMAGWWTVSLQVTNELGLVSEPATCRFEAVPTNNIHVEMSWNQPNSDLDLHLVQGGAEYNTSPGDCYYANPNPNWGDPGGADDPRLALDDRTGYGPENIQLNDPYVGDYEVYVNVFADNRSDTTEPIIATVKVWINGVVEYEGSKAVDAESSTTDIRRKWRVGFVRWNPPSEVGFGPDESSP